MRIYILQIHIDKPKYDLDRFDELQHFEDFNDLCAAFRAKLRYYRNRENLEPDGLEEPTLDECDNEAYGSFSFKDKDGNRVMARVADIDIGD